MTDIASTSPLAGRRALVTGASRGIGRDAALALARAGVDIAAAYVSRESDAIALRDEIVALGRRAIILQGDVSDETQAVRVARGAVDALGGVDILVHSAGVAIPARLDAVSSSDWRRAIETNLTSAFVIAQAVIPGMRDQRWGRLIFFSSVAAQVGGVVGPHYAASKAGLHGLMHYYAAHLAKEGVTSNVIAPALIDTDMVRNNPNARPDIIPVGRFGTVEEVASVVLLLAANGYITGQVMNVNGGWYPS